MSVRSSVKKRVTSINENKQKKKEKNKEKEKSMKMKEIPSVTDRKTCRRKQLIPITKLIREKITKLIRVFQLSLGGNTS